MWKFLVGCTACECLLRKCEFSPTRTCGPSSSEATCADLEGPLLQNTGSSQEVISSRSAGMNRETRPETSLASSWCWSDLVVLCHRFLPSPGSLSSLVSLSLSLHPELVVAVFFNVSLSVSACTGVPYDWRLCLLTQCMGLVLLWPYFSLGMLLLSENCFSVSPLFPIESRVLI